ncbi:MAG: helicase-related protein [Phycisphaerales bacterium]
MTEAAYGPTSADMIKHIGEAVGVTTRLQQNKVLNALRDTDSEISLKRLNTQQRKMALQLLKAASPVTHRMSRSTRSLLRRYHEKGLLTSPIAKREPLDIPVELSEKERAVYVQVENYISDTYQKAGPDARGAVGFVMTIYRRRLASSFHALRRTLTDRLAALHDNKNAKAVFGTTAEEDLPVDETADEQVSADEAADLEKQALVAEEEGEIQKLLGAIAKLGTDSKALRLEQELRSAFKDGYDSAIIFTQYTATLDFLKEFLAERMDLSIGTYSGRGGETRDLGGAWTPRSKEHIKRALLHGQIKLLVCTDAAGEGLNLQSCGVLVNYDLPWNPMKVEQRIGRIDRIGQKHPTVRVINLAYAGTVEADVYFALSDRIDLFQGLVGKLQPILARLPKTFEQTALGKREDRERAQAQVVHDLGTQITTADAEGL